MLWCNLFPVFFFLCHLRRGNAFPTGAGGCAGGTAAVGGYHLDATGERLVVSGTLLDGGIVVNIGSTMLVLDGTVKVAGDFPIGEDITISVDANVQEYLGVLIRLEAPTGVSTTAALLPGTDTQIASVCADPIVGITHTNNNTKLTTTGTIRFDEEVFNVALDITVVIVNKVAVSLYVYGRTLLNFRDLSAPIPTPVIAPVPTPVVVVPVPTPALAPTPVSKGMGGMGGGIMMEGGMSGGVMMEGGMGGMGAKKKEGMGGGAKKEGGGMGGMGVEGGMGLMGTKA